MLIVYSINFISLIFFLIFPSLLSETIPFHRDYQVLLPKERAIYRKVSYASSRGFSFYRFKIAEERTIITMIFWVLVLVVSPFLIQNMVIRRLLDILIPEIVSCARWARIFEAWISTSSEWTEQSSHSISTAANWCLGKDSIWFRDIFTMAPC